MGINQKWNSSHEFRLFRKKMLEASSMYWVINLHLDSFDEIHAEKIGTERLVDTFNNQKYLAKMYNKSFADLRVDKAFLMDRYRLYVITMVTGHLEAYIKEISFTYAASLCYDSWINESRDRVELPLLILQIIDPLINSSTIPKMLEYAQAYYEIDLKNEIQTWEHAYTIRCEGAHNGGFTSDQKKIHSEEIAKIIGSVKYGDPIKIEWNYLRNVMKSADDVCAKIDSKISSRRILLTETELLLRYNKKRGLLPPKRADLWSFLHDNYGIQGIKNEEKVEIARRYYARARKS